MVLSELDYDGLVDLAVFARIYNILKVESSVYEAIGSLTENFFNHVSVVNNESFDKFGHSDIVTILFDKLL